MIVERAAQTSAAAGAPVGDTGAVFALTPRSRGSVASPVPDPASHAADVAIDDWNDLFSAVRTRLELMAGTLPATAPGNDGVFRVRTGVLECVEALGQLHEMLGHERERRDRLELEIFDLRTALALALSELVEWHGPAPLAGSPRGMTNGV